MSTEREIVDLFPVAFKKKNLEILEPYLAESMTYQLLPSTVGDGIKTKTEWKNHLQVILDRVDSFELKPTKYFEHPLFVVVQSNATFPSKGGDFTQEVLLLFSFSKDESGALKIVNVTEYVDSFKVNELKAKMAGI